VVVNIEEANYSHHRPASGARPLRRLSVVAPSESADKCITIGIVNNMAGAAFKATERQFVSLLDTASKDIPIQVFLYMLPGLTRSETGGQLFANHYSSIDALLQTQLDGLIVTGREPRMANLRDEPYWDSFTQVLQWARSNTLSTVWSCLAAHAAVLHMDGIGRRKSSEKKFGVFECTQVTDHFLTQGLSSPFHVPHSRWNGVAETDLLDHGYTVLSRIATHDVDAFVKQHDSLFVFFQGHLEYGSDTLMREYRRDVGRFIRGEVDTYPLLPRSYFDSGTEAALTILRDQAIARRGANLVGAVGNAMDASRFQNSWQSSAVNIYRNWLQFICERKSESKRELNGRAICSISR
jgi:homoserine O-succinyltransferase